MTREGALCDGASARDSRIGACEVSALPTRQDAPHALQTAAARALLHETRLGLRLEAWAGECVLADEGM